MNRRLWNGKSVMCNVKNRLRRLLSLVPLWLCAFVPTLLLFSSQSSIAEDVLYYQCDAQGTPVAMTDAQGNIVWQGGCSPFGEDFHGEGTREPQVGYCGKQYDHQLGLYDFGARYYDPAKGRFTGVDPVTGDITDSQRLNSYAYALNNPYKYVDPDGRAPVLVYVYVNSVMASPDFQYDMMSLQLSTAQFTSAPSWSGAIDVTLDLAGVLLPGVQGSTLKAGKQVISKADDVADAGKVVGEMHHVASNKAIKSGFKKEFEAIFSKAGMSLEDSTNKILLEGHRGGHTLKYKEYVRDYLTQKTSGLEGQAYKDALVSALNNLKKELINNPKMPYKGGM